MLRPRRKVPKCKDGVQPPAPPGGTGRGAPGAPRRRPPHPQRKRWRPRRRRAAQGAVSDLSGCAGGIDRNGSKIYGWSKWVYVVERIKIWCLEYHSKEPRLWSQVVMDMAWSLMISWKYLILAQAVLFVMVEILECLLVWQAKVLNISWIHDFILFWIGGGTWARTSE